MRCCQKRGERTIPVEGDQRGETINGGKESRIEAEWRRGSGEGTCSSSPLRSLYL